jgi:hypothetical protein
MQAGAGVGSPLWHPGSRVVTDPTATDGYRSSLDRAAGRGWALRLFALVGSAGMAATLIGVVVLVLVGATWYERDHGRVAAGLMIYEAPWFNAIFVVMGLCVIAAAAMRWPFQPRHYGFLVVHAGLVAVIAGFGLGAGRLDGMLTCLPEEPARQIELPHDRLDAVVGDTQAAVAFQPLLFGVLPSLPRFVLGPVLGPADTSRSDNVSELLQAGPLRIRATGVVPYGARALGFGPAASGGVPAVRVRLLAALPMNGGAEEEVEDAWLTADGETLMHRNPLVELTLGAASHAALVRDLMAPDPGPHGRLRLYTAAGAQVVELDPAQAGSEIALDGGLTVRWTRVVVRPAMIDGRMEESADRPVNPVIELEIRHAPDAPWQRMPVASWVLPVSTGGRVEALLDHPSMLTGEPGKQGLQAQVILAPDRSLVLRWGRRSTGFVAAKILRADGPSATAVYDLVSGAGGMRVSAEVTWIPAAEPAPMPQFVHPDKAESTVRWLRIEASGPSGSASVWLPRGGREEIAVGDDRVFLSYQPAIYDLGAEHGFAVRLDRFTAGTDPGGRLKASYASDVTLVPMADGEPASTAHISMNRRLDHRSVTLFQTSYFEIPGQDGQPSGRLASVFTAATDPGRFGKWLGSVLIVAGTIILYLIAGRSASPRAAVAWTGAGCGVLGVFCLGVALAWWTPPMAVSWVETTALLAPAIGLLGWALLLPRKTNHA